MNANVRQIEGALDGLRVEYNQLSRREAILEHKLFSTAVVSKDEYASMFYELREVSVKANRTRDAYNLLVEALSLLGVDEARL